MPSTIPIATHKTIACFQLDFMFLEELVIGRKHKRAIQHPYSYVSQTEVKEGEGHGETPA